MNYSGYKLLLILCVLCVSAVNIRGGAGQSAPQTNIKVIPEPRQVELKKGICALSPDWSIVLESTATQSEVLAGQLISRDLESIWGVKVPVQVSDTALRNRPEHLIILGVPKRDKELQLRSIRKGVVVNEHLDEQGYVLSIEQDVIFLLANDPTGVFYAAQTLRQLISNEHTEVAVPCLAITDYPVYKYRGVQADITNHGVPTLAHFKEIIHTLAMYKMNLLTFTSESVQDILTPAEVKELANEAKLCHVELVAGIQAGLPIATSQGVLKPRQDEYYKYIEETDARIIPAYDSQFINLNCGDEVAESNNQAEFLAHLRRVIHAVRQSNKRPIIWGNIPLKYQALLEQIPDKAVILNGLLAGPGIPAWPSGQAYPRSGMLTYRSGIESIIKSGLSQFLCADGRAEGQIYPLQEYAVNSIDAAGKSGVSFVAAGKPVLGLVLALGYHQPGPGFLEANWFNILWTAECGWAPERSSSQAFAGKFTPAFFSINTNAGYEAARLMNQPNEILNNKSDILSRLYDDPFASDFHLQVPEFSGRMREIEKVSSEALKLLEPLHWKTNRHKETIEAWQYIARQWQFLAAKFLESHKLAQGYEILSSQQPLNEPDISANIQKYIAQLNTLRDKAIALQSEYQDVSNKRYRYASRLGGNKYAGLIRVFEDKIAVLNKSLEQYNTTGKLISPVEAGLKLKSFPERLVAPEMLPPAPELVKRFVWWDKNWAFRVFVRLENKLNREPLGANQFACPVEVNLNLTGLIQEALPKITGLPVGVTAPQPPDAEIDLNSIRVVEYNEAGVPIGEHPCQVDKKSDLFHPKINADVNITWVLRGKTYAGHIGYFYIYFDTLARPAKEPIRFQTPVPLLAGLPAGLRGGAPLRRVNRSGKNGVKNDRLKTYLFPEAGVVNSWSVRAIGAGLFSSLDIINEDGRFFDVPFLAGSPKFTLLREAEGPIMARYRTTSEGGFYKRFTFYEDLPICEVFTNAGAEQCDNYDSGNNFLSDPTARNKAEYIFSNYLTGQLKPETMEASGSLWVGLTRSDGLAVALITPDDRCTHYVGQDKSNKAVIGARTGVAHFVVYADQTKENIFTVLSQVKSVFTLSDPADPARNSLLIIQRSRGEAIP